MSKSLICEIERVVSDSCLEYGMEPESMSMSVRTYNTLAREVAFLMGVHVPHLDVLEIPEGKLLEGIPIKEGKSLPGGRVRLGPLKEKQMSKTVEAGPELDAQVAVEVMGWHRAEDRPTHAQPWPALGWYWADQGGKRMASRPGMAIGSWSPSTDWSAAGEVLEKVLSDDSSAFFPAIMRKCGIQEDTLGCYAVRRLLRSLTPLAICLAALDAVRAKGK